MDQEKKNEIQQLLDKSINSNIFKPVVKDDGQASSSSKAREIVGQIHDAAVIETVKSNEEIQTKFKQQAEKSIRTELDTIDQELKARSQVATYNANDEACKNYGIDKSVPIWQIRLMRLGSGFWFIIYWIFASLTIAPLNVFFKGIKSFIKTSWLVFVFALICYLIIVIGIPLLIKYLG